MKSAGAIQKNTEKRASRDVLFPLCENAADKLILFVLLGSVLLFILWPIACIALRSLRGADGGVSFAMFGTVLRQYGESLRNSVFVGVFTAVLSTILSLSAALVCATARGWKKTLCMIIMLVAMVSPPFVSSLAYIQLYGRRGWITYRLLHLSLNPYNRWGVILMQSISFVPLNAMFLSGILEKLDEGSLRSARDLGASGGAILRDIVLPLIRSATLVCLLLSFVRSLADFGTPIIIGGRFSTLAADIYLQVVGYSDLEKSSAMNMFLLVPSIVFFFVYRALMRRSDRLTDASRTAQTELGLSLPHCGAMGWGMIALSTVFFVMIVLQYGCVFLSGFLKSTKGVYSFTLQYGLKFRGYSRAEAKEKGRRYLELVGLAERENARIGELSGGQQQRVALARALIVEPKLCLLDEPLSNLDAALRVRMRGELKRLQRELGTTMVFVTHDQEEALILADSIAVMSEGELLQLGSAEEVFRHPANDYIASFLGLNDIVWKDDGSVLKVIRHGEKE